MSELKWGKEDVHQEGQPGMGYQDTMQDEKSVHTECGLAQCTGTQKRRKKKVCMEGRVA